MKIFQYVVFYQPKDTSISPEIITPVTTVLEKDEKIVNMKAIRALDEKWADKLDEIVIVVKLF